MGNVIIGVIAVSLTFVMATYGVWIGYDRYRVHYIQTRATSLIDDVALRVRLERQVLGGVVPVSRLPASTFAPGAFSGITASYGVRGGSPPVPYVCLVGPRGFAVEQAFARLATHRGGTVGPACDQSGAPADQVALTVFLPPA